MTHPIEERVTAGDALAAIAEVEPSALKLVGDLMEYNARSQEWIFEQLFLGEQHAHEETKRRLDTALDRLDLIERRSAWLLGGPDYLLGGKGA